MGNKSKFGLAGLALSGILGGSSGPGNDGGNGGSLIINYRGLVGGDPSWDYNLSGGSSLDASAGSDGSFTKNKDLTCVDGERDPDVNDNGVILAADYIQISTNYNKETGESGFSDAKDIVCDGKLNVVDISRIGFNWFRGQI